MIHLIVLGFGYEKRRNNAPRPMRGRRGLTDTRTLFRQYVTNTSKGDRVAETENAAIITRLGRAKAPAGPLIVREVQTAASCRGCQELIALDARRVANNA